MKKIALFIFAAALSVSAIFIDTPAPYKVGDEIKDFKLKSTEDKLVSLADYKASKGYIIVFTCNHCPYAKAYEDRIIKLQEKYSSNYPVVAINPNDPTEYPEDSFENMKKRASEKKFNFAYLYDETQEIARTFGATKTPHVYLVQKEKGKNVIKYIGAIDNNYQDEKAANEFYVQDAIASLESGKEVKVKETKAIGCSIKWKK